MSATRLWRCRLICSDGNKVEIPFLGPRTWRPTDVEAALASLGIAARALPWHPPLASHADHNPTHAA